MALAPSSRLGPYEVAALIGPGQAPDEKEPITEKRTPYVGMDAHKNKKMINVAVLLTSSV